MKPPSTGTTARRRSHDAEQRRDLCCTRIVPDRLRNVAIRIRVAGAAPGRAPIRPASDTPVGRPHDRIRRTVEVERHQTTARHEHAMDLVESAARSGTFRSPYPVVTTSKLRLANGSATMSPVTIWQRAAPALFERRPAGVAASCSMRNVSRRQTTARCARAAASNMQIAGAAGQVEHTILRSQVAPARWRAAFQRRSWPYDRKRVMRS